MSILNKMSNVFKKKSIDYGNTNNIENLIHIFSNKLKNEIRYNNEDNLTIIKDYLNFYNEYYPIVVKKMNNKNINNSEKKQLINQFVRINVLYNEYNNFTYYMLNDKFLDSYNKQKSFLNNKAFLAILNEHIDPNAVNQVMISIKIKILISILCFKSVQNISKQEIEFDFLNYYNEFNSVSFKSSKSKKLFLLIKSFNFYLDDQQNDSLKSLWNIYDLEYNNFKDSLHSLPLQYTGLGSNAYLTMSLPENFKSFINKNILNKDLKIINESRVLDSNIF